MKKIAIIGDSVTFGYDGQKNGPPIIAQTLASLANLEYVNLSIGGVSFGDSNGISGQVNRVNFKDFDYVLIDMGVNDYRFPHETIGNMQSALQSGIDKIKADNADTQIFLVTPLQSWEDGNGSLSQNNSMGFSQNDIDDMITRIARLNGLKYVDWRDNPIVTEANHKQTLGDGTVHPTAETQRLMAQRFFQVFFDSQPVNDDKPIQPAKPDQPNQLDKPTVDVQLEQIGSTNEVLPTSNRNFQKIFQLFQKIADYEMDDSVQITWHLQDFDHYNRACYDYLVNTVKLIKRQVDGYLSANDIVDDDFNDITSSGIVIPETIDLKEFKNIMNDNFKKLATVLVSISQTI